MLGSLRRDTTILNLYLGATTVWKLPSAQTKASSYKTSPCRNSSPRAPQASEKAFPEVALEEGVVPVTPLDV